MPTKIQNYDAQTVFKDVKVGAETRLVPDAKASAVANLKEVKKNFTDAIDPSNHFRSTWNSASSGHYIADSLMLGVKVLMLPWNLAGEVLDVALLPFKATKNATDAVYWGIRAGIEGVKGAPIAATPSDYEVGQVAAFTGTVQNQNLFGIGGEAPPSGQYLVLDQPVKVGGATVDKLFLGAGYSEGASVTLEGRLGKKSFGGVEVQNGRYYTLSDVTPNQGG